MEGKVREKKDEEAAKRRMNECEDDRQAPRPADTASEVTVPNLSSSEPDAQNSCTEARCQRVTYYSQSWEHFIRGIRFVFMRYEVEICGQLQ